MDDDTGFTLVEILVWASILGIVLLLATPPLLDATARLRVRAAAAEIAGLLQATRLEAVRQNVRVGLKLSRDERGAYHFARYADGDGDGVRNRDIAAGVDRELQAPRPLRRVGAAVTLGFPAGLPPRDPADPRRRLGRLDDPVRFNRSDLASFTPMGGATPGTIYLTDGLHSLAAVRVSGRTGKVRVLVYDPTTERWR